MKWIVVNIGCIECGVSSDIVGVFTEEKYALNLATILKEKADWRNGGENHYIVFPMPEDNIIKEEYMEYLENKE